MVATGICSEQMKSSQGSSLSNSNQLFAENKYWDSISELTAFHQLTRGVFGSSSSRIQNTISWNLSRLISRASRPEFENIFKENLLCELEDIQKNRFQSYCKKVAFERHSNIKKTQLVEVQKSRIEHCDEFSVIGWIACVEKISENTSKPRFKIKYGDQIYYVNASLTMRDDVKKVTNLPSYQFEIDFTAFFPPFRSISSDIIESFPKKAKLFIESSAKDIVFDLDLTKTFRSSSNPMILFTSHDLRNAGAQNSLLQMVDRLSVTTSCKMIVASPSDGPMREEYEGSNLSFLIDKNFAFYVDDTQLFLKRLYSQIFSLIRLNPRLVVANTFHTSLTILAATCLDIPSILIPRESEDPFDLFGKFPESIQKFYLSTPLLATKCIFVSKYTRSKWIAGDTLELKRKYLVINNGLNISKIFTKTLNLTTPQARKMLGIPLNANVALTVGTVTERKGQFDTIKSFVNYITTFPKANTYLVIIGLEKNIYSRRIREFVGSLPRDLSNKIKIFEATKSPSDNLCAVAYKASDLFIMSSKLESYPRVVLEAISYSLGIISTPCYGVKEMLRNDEAIFYDPGNIKKLFDIFASIFSDQALINKLKQSSRQAFRRLETVESMTKKYATVFQELLSNG